jgi:hypothetical protein
MTPRRHRRLPFHGPIFWDTRPASWAIGIALALACVAVVNCLTGAW